MSFRCSAILGVQPIAETQCETEVEALAWRDDHFGPRVDQVSITYTDGDRWAVRHLSHDGGDSGWRLWEGARFLGGGELADFECVAACSSGGAA